MYVCVHVYYSEIMYVQVCISVFVCVCLLCVCGSVCVGGVCVCVATTLWTWLSPFTMCSAVGTPIVRLTGQTRFLAEPPCWPHVESTGRRKGWERSGSRGWTSREPSEQALTWVKRALSHACSGFGCYLVIGT